MKPKTVELVATLQKLFADLAELDKTEPAEVDLVVSNIIGHIRSWRPVSLTSETTNPFVKA